MFRRLTPLALTGALLAASALAWLGLSKTPAGAQGASSPSAPAVTAVPDGRGNVVLAYPNGLVAIIKPEGAGANMGAIHVFRINNMALVRADTKAIEEVDSRTFNTETGRLNLPSRP